LQPPVSVAAVSAIGGDMRAAAAGLERNNVAQVGEALEISATKDVRDFNVAWRGGTASGAAEGMQCIQTTFAGFIDQLLIHDVLLCCSA
jgi:hypothetical protein